MKKLAMSREKAYELLELIHNKVNTEIDLSQFLDPDVLNEEIDSEVNFVGVSNGFLSELIHTITGYEIEIHGEVEELIPCPCCGFKTLTEYFNPKEGTGDDICPYCKWEDDGTTDIDRYCSINRGSISDYRKEIKRRKEIKMEQ